MLIFQRFRRLISELSGRFALKAGVFLMAGLGRFITIEGGEGVGKSVFIAGLVAALERSGKKVVSTREPGGTPVANMLRQVFSQSAGGERLTMRSELFLVNAGRSQHVTHVIRPALGEGKWVVSDRFADSTRVYQGMIGGLEESFVETCIREATEGLEPDLTFVLDCDVDIALARVRGRQAEADAVRRYDEVSRGVHQRMRECYAKLVERFPARMEKIDASQPPEAVLADALAALERRFPAEARR